MDWEVASESPTWRYGAKIAMVVAEGYIIWYYMLKSCHRPSTMTMKPFFQLLLKFRNTAPRILENLVRKASGQKKVSMAIPICDIQQTLQSWRCYPRHQCARAAGGQETNVSDRQRCSVFLVRHLFWLSIGLSMKINDDKWFFVIFLIIKWTFILMMINGDGSKYSNKCT